MEKQPSLLLYLTCMLLLQSCWFSFVVSASSLSRMNRLNNFTDQAALLTFKSYVTRWDTNNSLSNSWHTNTSFCSWIGVSCSRHRERVTVLNLPDMGLEGTIPPHIANLSFLFYLNLNNNSFHGHLPCELGNLRRLKVIDLRLNKLEGTIPHSLANLSELHFLALGGNTLRGNIPADLGRLFNLQYLILENNSISGEIPLPIFNISSLVAVSFAGNSLSGQLPADTGRFLPNLKGLYLTKNQMSGPIPISLSNASNLRKLSLASNIFSGSIPGTLGHLLHLEGLLLQENNLIGTIPSNIFNLSYLIGLFIGFNRLSGNLPDDIGNWLPNIQVLVVDVNRFSGKIPLSLGNASKLSHLFLAGNHFSGPVPTTLGKLVFLRHLNLYNNQLENDPGTKQLNFLTYLTNCRFLEYLSLATNPLLHGILPSVIGNFSILKIFLVGRCQVEGTVPRELGNLSSLMTLDLGGNNLHGTIPSTIGKLENLQRLNLGGNILKGSIPTELSNLRNIGELYLEQNQLSGGIPDIFYNISRLELLSLANNKLTRIPSRLWMLQDLLMLNLSHNSLRGVLPQEIGNLKKAVVVDLSENQFDSTIPNSMGHLEMLQYLDLSLNSLVGPIPQSFGELISIEVMNLSSNHLNGTIPKSLENLRYLKVLNLSFNSLEGEIPNGKVFKNFTALSFIGNHKLCSAPTLHNKLNVSMCPTHETKSKACSPLIQIILTTTIVIALVVCFSLFIIYHGKKKKNLGPIENSPTRAHRMISYQELLHATSNFSEANLIGVGSFGSVYKGTMIDGSFVAVKVLNIQSHRAWESFDAECKVMRNVRHRNLVKIITSCSNLDFRALILQFMPNGSLDQWLHSDDNNYLTLLQRIGIMIDVASAMEYLHHHYPSPVVHCDLKPSNVLLDEDMVAHVSDFGIAKLLDENKSATRTNTLGTMGYIAPEYGLVGKVSATGDVYSYGILLLEMLTRKKPTDSMFIGELSMRQWVNAAFPDAIIDVVDTNLLGEISSRGNNCEEVDDLHGRQLSCLLSIAEVGLLCSAELAKERINMKDVVVRLMKVKKKFLSM